MKTRNGFVSNSSSSSFIVLANDVDKKLINKLSMIYGRGVITVDYKLGETEFGWQNEEYNDFGSKLIFAYLQYKYVKDQHPEWLEMIEKVLKDINVDEIEWKIDINYPCYEQYAYIDHQSSSKEGSNTEIFDSETALRNFLFNEESYIQNGNDNE